MYLIFDSRAIPVVNPLARNDQVRTWDLRDSVQQHLYLLAGFPRRSGQQVIHPVAGNPAAKLSTGRSLPNFRPVPVDLVEVSKMSRTTYQDAIRPQQERSVNQRSERLEEGKQPADRPTWVGLTNDVTDRIPY